MSKRLKIIISGGGTGGHVFPAISIANALNEVKADIDILFVGAMHKIEMEKVPAAGYEIIGLPVSGFNRKRIVKNFSVIFKLLYSLNKARKIIKSFKPDVVIGVGGYASGPVLKIAGQKGIPTLIQEQNSYAGVTNKLLAVKAKKVCVAYDGMEKYFPKEKIILTGNPIRNDLVDIPHKTSEALKYFNLDRNKKVILILGGSLGARSINMSIIKNLKSIVEADVQVIWQTGKHYYENMRLRAEGFSQEGIKIHDFISRMDLAYSASDLIISRAGAGTISELCIVGKPVVLVPSPNVAEDHQTKNALALVSKSAALLVEDNKAEEELVKMAINLLNDEYRASEMAINIKKLAIKDSANLIANEIIKLAE